MRRSTCDRVPVGPVTAMFRYPKTATACDVAGLRLPLHGVVGPLPRLFALEFIGEGCEREQDLVSGGVERPLTVLEIEPNMHAAAINCFNAYAVSMASRSSRDSSDITST
jgi:hypothetical protein